MQLHVEGYDLNIGVRQQYLPRLEEHAPMPRRRQAVGQFREDPLGRDDDRFKEHSFRRHRRRRRRAGRSHKVLVLSPCFRRLLLPCIPPEGGTQNACYVEFKTLRFRS